MNELMNFHCFTSIFYDILWLRTGWYEKSHDKTDKNRMMLLRAFRPSRAQANLLNFLSPRSDIIGLKDKDSKVLENLSFFDVGCGSGIHSAAAAYAGASHVISFDRQEGSLQVTRVLQHIAEGSLN